jgi:PAS domain S-box-containing protein
MLPLALQRFVDAFPQAVIIAEPDGRIVMTSHRADVLFGWDRAELLGRSVTSLLHPSQHGELARDLTPPRPPEALTARGPIHGITKQGHSTSALEIWIGQIEDDKAGRQLWAFSTISSPPSADAAEPSYRTMVEAAPTAMLLIHHDQTIRMANRRAEVLFGYAQGALVGQLVAVLFPEPFVDWHPPQGESLLTGVAAGEPAVPAVPTATVICDATGRRKDGSEFLAELELSPIDATAAPATLASIREVTERRRAHLELTRSNAELDQFAYIASHDLQEPLRMVTSYTQLLAQRYQGKLDAKAYKYIGYAVEGAKRMQRLIDDLFRYSRLVAQPDRIVSVDVKAVVDTVLAILNPTLTKAKATVEVDDLPVVAGDEPQLQLLFQNLLSNAVKFRREAPLRIRVAAHREGGYWRFSVHDNGIGIEMKHAESIFTMFHRVHRTGRYQGSGIGLAIARRIVERHGGRIWIESVVGEGTALHFTLRARRLETSPDR